MALIFMALVFFTLYEQTYGSWVTFTDRLLTKDVVPSLVVRDGTPLPWSIIAAAGAAVVHGRGEAVGSRPGVARAAHAVHRRGDRDAGAAWCATAWCCRRPPAR